MRYDGVVFKPKLDVLYHHGILNQKWGVRNGPPYPLGSDVSTGKRLKSGASGSISKTKPLSSNKASRILRSVSIEDANTAKSYEAAKKLANLKEVRSAVSKHQKEFDATFDEFDESIDAGEKIIDKYIGSKEVDQWLKKTLPAVYGKEYYNKDDRDAVDLYLSRSNNKEYQKCTEAYKKSALKLREIEEKAAEEIYPENVVRGKNNVKSQMIDTAVHIILHENRRKSLKRMR